MHGRNGKREVSSKKQKITPKYSQGLPLSPQHYPSSRNQPSQIFESGPLKTHKKRESGLSEREMFKLSNKIVTTDQSNNGCDSKIHESIFISERKGLNQEYFNEPLTFKGRKKKGMVRPREGKQLKLQNISLKLGQMTKLVHSQQKQLQSLKGSMNEKQLSRLIKMQSIEKLQLVEDITKLGVPSSMKTSSYY